MDFLPSDEETELAGLVRRICGDLVTKEVLGSHGEGGFDRGVWDALLAAGVLEAGWLAQCAALVEVGRTLAPVPYVTAVASGRGDKVYALALPDAGLPSGFAVHDGLLSGSQTAVMFGAFADAFLIPADGKVFLVEQADVRAQRTVDHADAALVELEDAPGEPLDLDPELLRQRMTVALCAVQLGVLESALHRTAGYARTRKQFDHPIGSFQAVRQRLADAYIDVEAVRLTLWQAAWRLSEELPAAEEVATAKYWAAEAGHRVAHTAVHVHGGVGIDVDHELHRYFAAAKRIEFALGGATAQLRALGGLLAAEPA
ncbi:acyl-CoA dehydrogenase family protein [Amycolatopsis sp.]|uniref:acyl-CoA dehydrogenase family protein n=1 Tax=Amycolatopsis sp. TaxID=37632 RepID=UPI002B650053|nr:acyl-CoA dehydrogenase family protein [Amycolatopsis sp.]HVV10251.1 acyl-CoA dehydrogenase family protein [Amycolatopsis sp.]